MEAGFDAAARVEQWVADAREKAERYQAMRVQAQQVAVTDTAPDGMVTVTVDSAGNVTDLRITDKARELSGERIAAAVLGTIRRAQAKLPDRLAEVMAATIGSDQQTVDTIVGNYRAKFPEPVDEGPAGAADVDRLGRLAEDDDPAPAAPPRRPAPRADDEDDDGWSDQSFIRNL